MIVLLSLVGFALAKITVYVFIIVDYRLSQFDLFFFFFFVYLYVKICTFKIRIKRITKIY